MGPKVMVRDGRLRVRLLAAIQRIALRAPSFLHIVYKLPIVERALPGSYLATDGRAIYVDPGKALRLSDGELAGMLLHQALHVALRHVDGIRAKRNREAYAVAVDAVVNRYVREIGLELPFDAITPEVVSRMTGVAAEKIARMPAEEIYYILLKRARQEDVEKLGIDIIDVAAPACGRCGLPQHACGCKAGGEEMVELPTPEDVARAFDLHFGLGFAEKVAVDPVELRRQMGVARERLEWRRILRNAMFELARTKKRYTWLRDSRKAGSEAVGRVRVPKPKDIHLVVLVDVSGSTVAARAYEDFLNEVAGIVKTLRASATLITWDDDVTGVYRVGKGRWDAVVDLKPRGGGGTNPIPAALKAIEEIRGILSRNARAGVGTIMFTDGIFHVANPSPLRELAKLSVTAVYCYTVEDHPEWFDGWLRVKMPLG